MVGAGCANASRLNGSLFERGARFDSPTLWLYGEHDPFYDIGHSRANFVRFQTAGGRDMFLQFNVPGGYGHAILSAPALWEAPVAAYLDALTGSANSQ